MRLALFDLDHTLLPIDSADTWSHYLVRMGRLDSAYHAARITEFATAYKAGTFDVEEYLAYQMDLLTQFTRPQLEAWRDQFMREHVAPHVRPAALALIDQHRAAGDTLILITGTNAFLTQPIAALFGLDHLLAVQFEESGGRFTGRYIGTHTYREGKVRAAEAFCAARGGTLAGCAATTFYSDSINDLPLLERVTRPVVTNGDPALRAIAQARGWETLDLFAEAA
ncbi:MAG TPA: HAD family hydrolase [Burkholderiaceae bacterium]|nr:HAD family hydrolase [Burkholderiaceae bacterium]